MEEAATAKERGRRLAAGKSAQTDAPPEPPEVTPPSDTLR